MTKLNVDDKIPKFVFKETKSEQVVFTSICVREKKKSNNFIILCA